MQRRKIALAGLFSTASFGCRQLRAQPVTSRAVTRIAWFAGSAGPLPTPAYLEALRADLRERGWVAGQNLSIDIRWGDRDSAAGLTPCIGCQPDMRRPPNETRLLHQSGRWAG